MDSVAARPVPGGGSPNHEIPKSHSPKLFRIGKFLSPNVSKYSNPQILKSRNPKIPKSQKDKNPTSPSLDIHEARIGEGGLVEGVARELKKGGGRMSGGERKVEK